MSILALSGLVTAQTPGLIIEDAGAGAAVLDPDGDGYISEKTDGVQIGFINPPNDYIQSEIPYAPVVKEDPIGDLDQGPTCGFSELIGVDSTQNYAVLAYFDGTNVLFRIRIGEYIPNQKTYSILFDTDQKFGFTGPNADPNAVPGNAGFEIEVALLKKTAVNVYDVDGTVDPVLSSSNPVGDYSQVSVANSNFCDTPDYFYDFYIPFSQLEALGVTDSTLMRFAVVTNMNPGPSIGSNAISDVCGNCSESISLDLQLSCAIESQTPDSVAGLNDGILERTGCPTIDEVSDYTQITGSSSEADGTVIDLYIYDEDEVTLLASGSTTVMSGKWTLEMDSLTPALSLSVGQVVKATATAPDEGASVDNCDVEFVVNCEEGETTVLSESNLDIVGGNKGYEVTFTSRPAGTKLYLYNSDYTLVNTDMLKDGVTNPFVTTVDNESFVFQCQTGQCFENDVYYFVLQEPGKCESELFISCYYADGGESVAPTVTTSPIDEETAVIAGTGAEAGAEVLLFVNDEFYAHATTDDSFGFSFNVSGLEVGDYIYVKQIEEGKCISPSSTTLYVTRAAYTPVINTSECNTYPLSTISGISVEGAGASIKVYRTNGATDEYLGEATVQADYSWELNGLTINAGDSIYTVVGAGGILTESAHSDTVVFTAQTSISDYAVTLNSIAEGQTSITGTVSGGTYPVNLNLYIDDWKAGTVGVLAAGSWNMTVDASDMYLGGTVNVTVQQEAMCESEYSDASTTIECQAPLQVEITANAHTFCDGTYGEIVILNSEVGVYYVPVLASDSAVFGYGQMGNGGELALTMTTYQVTEPVNVSIYASRIPFGYCDTFVADSILFEPGDRPVDPIAANVQYYCGAQTLSDLVVNEPDETTMYWYDASEGGNELSDTTLLVSGTEYYVEAVCDTNLCTSSNRTLVTAEEGDPLPAVADSSQTLCYESTLEDINAQVVNGPGTLVWYSDSTGTDPLPTDTELETGVTYYVQVVNGECSSETLTSVEISLGMVPDTTTWLGGVDGNWNNEENWDLGLPSVCSHVVIPDAGDGVVYPVITEPSECLSITFEPGAGVLGLQYLTYTKAYVQLDLKPGRWYTLTAPLKTMFSGDYYYTGVPMTYMRLFDDVNPDIAGDTVAVGTWTQTFANNMVPMEPGMGFAFQVDTFAWNYPRGDTLIYDDLELRFPRELEPDVLRTQVIPFSGVTGKPYAFLAKDMPKDTTVAYRFAMENENGVLEDVQVAIKEGLNLVGNPLMSHLDFKALYATNSSVISEKVKFWNGTTFTTYMAGSGIAADMDMDYTSIPPMQSFFVDGLVGIPDGSVLQINLDEHFITDEATKLRSAKASPKVMHIKSSLNNKTSCVALAYNESASNSFGDEDATKLFSMYDDVPEVYTLADGKALDINQFSQMPIMVPVGIKTTETGKINLEFVGADEFDDVEVTLLNTMTGEQQNLKTDGDYELEYDGSTTDASLFVEFRAANTVTDTPESEMCGLHKCIQVYAQDDVIYAISSEDDPIKSMTIWEDAGKQLYNADEINKSEFSAHLTTSSQICVVRVETEQRTMVIKVLME